jgi:hypothetical protein
MEFGRAELCIASARVDEFESFQYDHRVSETFELYTESFGSRKVLQSLPFARVDRRPELQFNLNVP